MLNSKLMLSQALSVFFIKLAVGILPWLTLIHIEDTGKTFFRLLLFLSFFTASLGLVFHFSIENWLLIIFVFAVLVLFLMASRLEFRRVDLLILPVFFVGSAVFLAHDLVDLNDSSFHLFLDHYSGSLLMGASLVAMVTGHWYLIRPRLSFHYLKQSVLILLGLVIFRVGFVLLAIFSESPRGVWDILFLTRMLWGLVLPLFFVPLAYGCARVSSNRSATGILYFITGSIFMGELMAEWI